MSKKEVSKPKQAVALKQETLPALQGSILPAVANASPELKARIAEVADNLESVDNFRLPRIKMTADGAELIEGEEPCEELEGIIIHSAKFNQYYEKPYSPSLPEPPTCFSRDGLRPDKSAVKPQHATCKGCPKAEFGTNSMGKGKACRNLKPVYILLSTEAIMPRQLTITPTSLKAANQYFLDLTERGHAYRKVKTKIQFVKDNPRDTYRKLKFSLAGKLTPAESIDIEALRNWWMPAMTNQIVDQAEVEQESPVAQTGPVQGGEY